MYICTKIEHKTAELSFMDVTYDSRVVDTAFHLRNLETKKEFVVYGLELRLYYEDIVTKYYDKVGFYIIYTVTDIEMELAKCLVLLEIENIKRKKNVARIVDTKGILVKIDDRYETIMKTILTMHSLTNKIEVNNILSLVNARYYINNLDKYNTLIAKYLLLNKG